VSTGHRPRRGPALTLTLLCIATAAMCLWEAAVDAPTIDEPVYVSAGLTGLVRHDLRLNPQHPPLAKVLAALPVLAARPVLPGGAGWREAKHRIYAKAFLQSARAHGKLREVTFLSRLVPILELLATALVVYALARRLAGPAGGLFAAGLWLLDPFVIGLGHLDGIDLPFTLAALVTSLAIVRWLEVRSLWRAAAIGFACGAALVLRDTGPLVLVVATATVAVASRDVRPTLAVLAAAFGFVWLVYLALDPAFTLHHASLLPQRYLDGFHALAAAHSHPRGVFLLDRHWHTSHWFLWPISLVIKVPVTLVAAYALVPFLQKRIPADARRRVYGAIVPAAVVLAAFTAFSPVYLGFRYMLPVLALATVAVAPLVRAPRLVPLLLIAGSAIFTVTSLPHSIAWTEPPFRPAYRFVTDSNLDWGQDAYRLQQWARGKHAWIACNSPAGAGCTEDVADARPLGPRASPRSVHGWVAMSSTLLNLSDWDVWLRHVKPAGNIDGAILLYRLP
jgi:Dolichyl-phosphate-mannose-protein mannosyltransferase